VNEPFLVLFWAVWLTHLILSPVANPHEGAVLFQNKRSIPLSRADHLQLPYKQLTDENIRNLPIGSLVDDGFLFIWVTGRVYEMAIEFLEGWG
jgi:hypothetical protein